MLNQINKKIKNKGQSAMEYSMLFIVIGGALLVSQNFIKRGVQGRWQSAVDGLGDQYDPQATVGYTRTRLLTNSQSLIRTVPLNSGEQQITERYDFTNSFEVTDGEISVGAY